MPERRGSRDENDVDRGDFTKDSFWMDGVTQYCVQVLATIANVNKQQPFSSVPSKVS